jgi:hypothetical protein
MKTEVLEVKTACRKIVIYKCDCIHVDDCDFRKTERYCTCDFAYGVRECSNEDAWPENVARKVNNQD